MSNLIDYSTIQQTIVSNSTQRLALTVPSSFNPVFQLSLDNLGNLVLFDQTTNTQVWNSNTSGDVPLPEYSSFEATLEDGNLTLYVIAGNYKESYWSTNTGGNPGAYLVLGIGGGLYIRNQQGNNIYTLHEGANPNISTFSSLTDGNSISSDNSNSFVTSPIEQYYYWDNATQNYSLMDTSSIPVPSQIVGIDSDNAGNFYFYFTGIFQDKRVII